MFPTQIDTPYSLRFSYEGQKLYAQLFYPALSPHYSVVWVCRPELDKLHNGRHESVPATIRLPVLRDLEVALAVHNVR